MGVFPPFWSFYCNFGKIHWMRKIQMVDTKNQYLAIKEEVDLAIQNVLDTAAYINGKAVQDFSKNLGEYLGVQYVVPCANGTDALQIAMMGLGLEQGDEVITVDFTFAATVEVIALLKLTPVLIDVDPDTFNIDIESDDAVWNWDFTGSDGDVLTSQSDGAYHEINMTFDGDDADIDIIQSSGTCATGITSCFSITTMDVTSDNAVITINQTD